MKKLGILSLFIFFISCSKDDTTPGIKTFAAADIYTVTSSDGENYTKGDLIGNASIEYQDSIITMTVSISNMEPNTSHAMHLHMGSLEKPGHHWNQGTQIYRFCNARSLGQVWAKVYAGDVGNIDIDSDGNGTFTIRTDLWAIGTNNHKDISGTVLYIHQQEEDFIAECDPNHDHNHGHVNAKIAGGTIVFGSQVLN